MKSICQGKRPAAFSAVGLGLVLAVGMLMAAGCGKKSPAGVAAGPASGARLTNSVVQFAGQAGDNIGVASVQWQLSNAGGTNWQTALGTTNWSATVSNLMVGTNVFSVRAVDLASNVSQVVSQTNVLLAQLVVSVSGWGQVSPTNYTGTNFLEAGTPCTLTAIPRTGYTFANWTGGIQTNSALLTFSMPTGLVLQANFVPSGSFSTNWNTSGSYSFGKATYNGLFADYTNGVSASSAGSFKLTTTVKGAFSASLQIGSTRYSLSGQFGTNGIATNKPGKSPLNVSLRINTANPAQIGGTVSGSNASWVATLYGDRAVFDGKLAKAPQQGLYTIVIPGNPDAANTNKPGGDSFGTVTVDKLGNIHLSGSLADGTKVTQAAVVSTNGWWPLYVPLYSGQGLLWSWLSFSNSTASSLHGDQFVWAKPGTPKSNYYRNEFEVETNILGSAYANPKPQPVLAFTNANIVLTGGGLAGSITNPVTLGSNSKVTSANKAKLTFSLSSGSFSGAVTNGKKSITFSGVVLVNSNIGSGYFLGTNSQSGRVEFLGH